MGDVCATARAVARVLGFFDSTNVIECGGILKGTNTHSSSFICDLGLNVAC
jgi:hypothetical protein